MFAHVGFDVRDWKMSRAFYQAALAPLGIRLISDSEEWQASGFGKDAPLFWVAAGKPSNGEDEVHVCFAAKSRAEVRAFHEAALRAGGRDHGSQGPRAQYGEHYYGAFVLDSNGNNIEANCFSTE